MNTNLHCAYAGLLLCSAALVFYVLALGADIAARALIRKWRKTP